MSDPTGDRTSDPTAAWQTQPEASPPAAQPSWAPPAAPTRPPLPGMLLAAAIVLFVAGTLAGLLGALVLLSSAIYDQLPNTGGSGLSEEQFRAAMQVGRIFAIGFGIGGLVVAAAHIASGVGIIRRAGWARIVGMVVAALALLVSALFLLLTLVAFTQSLPAGSLSGSGMTEEQYREFARLGGAFAVGLFGTSLVAYLFVLVALIRGGAAFR